MSVKQQQQQWASLPAPTPRAAVSSMEAPLLVHRQQPQRPPTGVRPTLRTHSPDSSTDVHGYKDSAFDMAPNAVDDDNVSDFRTGANSGITRNQSSSLFKDQQQQPSSAPLILRRLPPNTKDSRSKKERPAIRTATTTISMNFNNADGLLLHSLQEQQLQHSDPKHHNPERMDPDGIVAVGGAVSATTTTPALSIDHPPTANKITTTRIDSHFDGDQTTIIEDSGDKNAIVLPALPSSSSWKQDRDKLAVDDDDTAKMNVQRSDQNRTPPPRQDPSTTAALALQPPPHVQQQQPQTPIHSTSSDTSLERTPVRKTPFRPCASDNNNINESLVSSSTGQNRYGESSKPRHLPQQQFVDMSLPTMIPRPSTLRTSQQQNGNTSSNTNNKNAETKATSSNAQTTIQIGTSALLKKAALSRPFGRDDPLSSILPQGTGWVVEVSDPEWHQHQYRYRILVQRRAAPSSTGALLHNSKNEKDGGIEPASSFTAAFTWRSVPDFEWLSCALQHEFHGALLLPILDLECQSPTYHDGRPSPVKSSILKHWLSDVLNGIRGSGEWILPIVQHSYQSSTSVASTKGMVDVIKSSSMEAFLYRNAVGRSLADAASNISPDASPCRKRLNEKGQQQENEEPELGNDSFCTDSTLLSSIWTALAVPLELCIGPQHMATASSSADRTTGPLRKSPARDKHKHSPRLSRGVHHQLRGLNCASQALGTAAEFDVQNSIMDGSSSVVSGMSVTSIVASPRGSSSLAIHSELLFAEKDLALHYERIAQNTMEKLDDLVQAEERISDAWKRFSLSLANLFAYEKDAETENLSDSKIKRENMPFRKVDKDAICECIQAMTVQKTNRALPGLGILASMISAYVSDLSSVEPSVDIYAKAIRQLSFCQLPVHGEESSGSNHSGGITASSVSTSSSDVKQTISGSSWEELKDWTLRSIKKRNDGNHAEDQFTNGQTSRLRQQAELKNQLLTNERLLRLSLTTMLRTAPFRLSRIAWRYWNTEASHCAQLTCAAADLRSKLNFVSQSSVSKLAKRHSKEEKSDYSLEMELIQRIVTLGQPREKTLVGTDEQSKDNAKLSEVENGLERESRTSAKRNKILDVARHRIGRWNAILAMSLLESVGVTDPNVHVEETTRDIRLVRKYAIGLRECLNRCVETVRSLQEVITGNERRKTANDQQSSLLPKQNSAINRLKMLRGDFLAEMTLLFSGTLVEDDSIPKRSSMSRTVLFNAGIDTSDPFGWLTNETELSQRRSKSTLPQKNVGDLAIRYVDARDAQVEWLLSSLDGLLNEYYQRIEVVEGFVYMECVGIQLEKHFSVKRAKALAAFEKKTDLTAAMNMARKKRMVPLLRDLQIKFDKLGTEVSHTTVKETKEAHLESKILKTLLHNLAMRRLTRARETSTERIAAILELWTKEEEINATEEIKVLGEAMSILEKSVCKDDSKSQ